MFGIGPWELLVVFAIVLLLFGGKRLPGIATGLGSAIRNFKSAMKEGEADDRKTLPKGAEVASTENKTADTAHS
jgi:sec-independent protein translocase protein TatA